MPVVKGYAVHSRKCVTGQPTEPELKGTTNLGINTCCATLVNVFHITGKWQPTWKRTSTIFTLSCSQSKIISQESSALKIMEPTEQSSPRRNLYLFESHNRWSPRTNEGPEKYLCDFCLYRSHHDAVEFSTLDASNLERHQWIFVTRRRNSHRLPPPKFTDLLTASLSLAVK